jgi:hypothetical protein
MPTTTEDRIRAALRAEADAVTVPADLGARIEARTRGQRRQRTGLRVAAAVVVALGIGGASIVAGQGGGDGPATETVRPGAPGPEGGWVELPEGPVGARFEHAAAWTGEEMIVLGGFGDDGEPVGGAAAYAPATGTWRSLEDAPAEVRGAPVAVWTGSELVAFGNDDDYRTAGAVYDPDRDAWRTTTDPGLGTLTSSGSYVAWTGDRVLVAGFFTPDAPEGSGTQGAALYDPATDTWDPLPDAPGDLPIFGDAVWTGTELVVVGAGEGSGAAAPDEMTVLALDPAAGTWRSLPAPPQGVVGNPVVAWTGSEVVVGGGVDHAAAGPQRLVETSALDPAAGTWRSLSPAPVAFTGDERYREVVVDGRVAAFATDDPDGRMLLLDPAAGTWAYGPAPVGPAVEGDEIAVRVEAPAVSTGDAVLVWGGGVAQREGEGITGCCRPLADGAQLTLPSDLAPAPAG